MLHVTDPPGPTWLLLMVSLPPRPSSLRVRTWRRLRALGAVPLKSSVYLLPATPDHYEQLQWLAQEAKARGGEATLLQVERIENVAFAEIVRLFQEARDSDWRPLAERYRKLLQGLERASPPAPGGRRRVAWETELARLARESERVRRVDFFDAPAGREVERLREAVEARLRPPATGVGAGAGVASLQAGRGRRWATRPRPHVDRIASAWLVKRFVDPEAEFVFARPEVFPPDAIPFDVVGAELGHQGEDCTFETLLGRAGLRDPALARLAEIVHEADLGDQKYHREEARGVDLVLRGLLAALDDDHAVLAHGLVLFDGLYRLLGREGERRGTET